MVSSLSPANRTLILSPCRAGASAIRRWKSSRPKDAPGRIGPIRGFADQMRTTGIPRPTHGNVNRTCYVASQLYRLLIPRGVGLPMTLANMRRNGVHAVTGTCEACRHEADLS